MVKNKKIKLKFPFSQIHFYFFIPNWSVSSAPLSSSTTWKGNDQLLAAAHSTLRYILDQQSDYE